MSKRDFGVVRGRFSNWLKQGSFSEHVVSVFSNEAIAGCILLTLANEELKGTWINQLGIRKLTLMRIRELIQNCDADSFLGICENSKN